MYVVGFVGGPCSGKSKCLPLVREKLEQMGYNVFVIPESATEISLSGILPHKNVSMETFQEFVIDNQISKENLFFGLQKVFSDKLVLLCDRTILDSLIYIHKNVFEDKVSKHGLSVDDIFNRYDMIIHLTTIAEKLPKKYKFREDEDCQNVARRETPEQALLVDEKSKQIFFTHNNFHIINPTEKIEEKINTITELILENFN